MSKSQREKGKRGELQVAELLRRVPGFEDCCRRASGSERKGAGGSLGRDLENCAPLCAQVKLSARPQPLAALAEARLAAKPGEISVAFTRQCSRRASGEWAATVSVEDFCALLILAFPKREQGAA